MIKWTDKTPMEQGLYRHCCLCGRYLGYTLVWLHHRGADEETMYMTVLLADPNGRNFEGDTPYDFGSWYGPIELPGYKAD